MVRFKKMKLNYSFDEKRTRVEVPLMSDFKAREAETNVTASCSVQCNLAGVLLISFINEAKGLKSKLPVNKHPSTTIHHKNLPREHINYY